MRDMQQVPALSYGVQWWYSLSPLLQQEGHSSGYWCLDGTRAILLTTFPGPWNPSAGLRSVQRSSSRLRQSHSGNEIGPGHDRDEIVL